MSDKSTSNKIAKLFLTALMVVLISLGFVGLLHRLQVSWAIQSAILSALLLVVVTSAFLSLRKKRIMLQKKNKEQ